MMWESLPAVMYKSLLVHNEVLRRTLREHHGYEVKTEGDGAMLGSDLLLVVEVITRLNLTSSFL